VPVQILLAQSTAARHERPALHTGQPAPPQSMSDSVPFLAKSVHVAARQTPWHTRLTQSPAPTQVAFVPQAEHVPPPQSAEVSAPFRIASTQVAGWQIPPEQLALTQSVAAPQREKSGQGAHCAPPQSLSLSKPFFRPSVQPGA